jgi:hypothetical protein
MLSGAGGPGYRFHSALKGAPSKLCLGGRFPRLNTSIWGGENAKGGRGCSTALSALGSISFRSLLEGGTPAFPSRAMRDREG